MNRPWQIWATFVLCLIVVIPAMGWLTLKALQLDRAEALAQATIEFEDLVQSALWRMDVELLTPLVAQEAARPYTAYDPFYFLSTPDFGMQVGGSVNQVPSPLLVQPSPHIRLHFQLDAEGTIRSPQAPAQEYVNWAIENGFATGNVELNNDRVATLRTKINYDDLLAKLTDDVPDVQILKRGTVSQTSADPKLPLFNNSVVPRSSHQGSALADNDDASASFNEAPARAKQRKSSPRQKAVKNGSRLSRKASRIQFGLETNCFWPVASPWKTMLPYKEPGSTGPAFNVTCWS